MDCCVLLAMEGVTSMGKPTTVTADQKQQFRQKYHQQTEKICQTAQPFLYDIQQQVQSAEAGAHEEIHRQTYDMLLAPEEFEVMRNQQVPMPEFTVLNKQAQKALSKKERAAYKEQEKAFLEKLDKWTADETVRHDAIRELSVLDRKVASEHVDVPPNPDAMLAHLEKVTKEKRVEREVTNQLQAKAWTTITENTDGMDLAVTATRAYLGSEYTYINHNLRTGEKTHKVSPKARTEKDISEQVILAEHLTEAVSHRKLGQDMVLRRGVGPFGFADSFSLPGLSYDQARAEIQQKLGAGEDVLLHEKGMCSTSCYADGGFDLPVEYIFLVHKDTQGINIAGTDLAVMQRENEVLLNADTKFKVLKYEEKEKTASDKIQPIRMFLEVISKSPDSGQPNTPPA